MFDKIFILILLAIGTALAVISEGRQLHLLLISVFSFSVAVTSFIDATYKSLEGNSTEIDIKSDPVLTGLASIGLKGRYSSSVAIMFASLITLFLFSLIVFKLTPHSPADAMRLAGLDPDKQHVRLTNKWERGTGPPESLDLDILSKEEAIGKVSQEEILIQLRDLAEKGLEASNSPEIIKAIQIQCQKSEGLCRVSDFQRVNISFSEELDLSSSRGGEIANICPTSSNVIARDIRNKLLGGAMLRVHPTNTRRSLIGSTQFIGTDKVAEYDPFLPDPETKKIPALALRACSGTLPYIQLPKSYERAPFRFTKADKDGFTTGFLSIENPGIENRNKP